MKVTNQKILYQRANVLTMENDLIHHFTDVLVENGKIAAIGRNLPSEDALMIPCEGKYLMPALFDSHAHLNSSEMGKLFIANGITSIRHLSGGEKTKAYTAEIEAGREIGPTVYASGRIYDGIDAADKSPTYGYIASEADAERAVMDTIESGYLWVKTYPSIRPEHLKRLMQVAQHQGIKVCGHMSYRVDSKDLRDWGYHCCEHSSSLPPHPADIEYLAKSGMWFCPTQVVCETLPDYVWEGKKLDDLHYYDYVPEVIRDFWQQKNEKIIEGYRNRGLKPDIRKIIERGKQFMKHSDRFMAGSDTMYPGMIAGFSLHDELEKLVTLYDRTPYEALRAATVRPAYYVGAAESKGQVKVGMDADLLILNENPLAAIQNTRSIEAVIQMGIHFDRNRLDGLLEAVKTEPATFFELLF